MARGLMYDTPGRSGRSSPDKGDSRQAPLSGPAASLGSFEPPRTIGLPRPPAPPVMGPPVGGPGMPQPGVGPPMATLPFIPGPQVPVGPGLPPGVGLPGPDPSGMAGQPAGPQLPQNINWAELMPLLQAMFA